MGVLSEKKKTARRSLRGSLKLSLGTARKPVVWKMLPGGFTLKKRREALFAARSCWEVRVDVFFTIEVLASVPPSRWMRQARTPKLS